MPEFSVSATVSVNFSVTTTIKAATAEAAQEKFDAMSSKICLGLWEPAKGCPDSVEWEEGDTEIDDVTVDEA